VDLADHLAKVAAFFAQGDVVELDTEVLSASVRGDAGWLVALIAYRGSAAPKVRTSMFAECNGAEWRIRHLHFSSVPTG
jgi:hypothetical protein